jgi:rhodanese-related sulfurtransferase
MSEIRSLTTEELERRLRLGGRLEFWNVVTDPYFKHEMIPGSRRVRLNDVGREVAAAKLPKDREIVVYCGGPTCSQSRLAAEKLETLGFTRVSAYEGGLEAWKEAGQPVEYVDEPAPAATTA